MCRECRAWPCDPRCPNAAEPPPVYRCGWCGEPVSEELYYDMDGAMVCPACIQARERVL